MLIYEILNLSEVTTFFFFKTNKHPKSNLAKKTRLSEKGVKNQINKPHFDMLAHKFVVNGFLIKKHSCHRSTT